MSDKPDLLVKDNLIRHLSEKITKLDEIKRISASCRQHLLLESLLVTIVSYLEAALLDTVREYANARTDEICELMLSKLNKKDLDKKKIREIGFDNYLIEKFIEDTEFTSIMNKYITLKNITGIKIDLKDEQDFGVLEAIARRNCFIHNDLIANNTYFLKAGKNAEQIDPGEKLNVTASYLSERITDIQFLFEKIKTKLESAYQDRSNVAAIRELWDYLFENRYPMLFDECWDTTGSLIRYKGPKMEELQELVSTRTICLFTAWKSFFNGAFNRDLKFFPDLFYVNAKDRAMYSKKLKYLMDCFEKIDFQTFKVQVYSKG